MKKVTTAILTILMCIVLMACGEEQEVSQERTSATETITDEGPVETSSAEDGAETNNDRSTSAIASESGQTDDEEGEIMKEEAMKETEGAKILVAYFSATNTTEGVAEQIAASLPADLYEIVPEQPYTDADLNYNDDNSRSTQEMNDSASRPAISGAVENMEQCDILFIGYPIWWGEAPRIVSTFVESYDFTGKTIVPFCTSGGSGVGSSATNLEALTSGASWLPGTRLSGKSSREEIAEWINGLELDIKAE